MSRLLAILLLAWPALAIAEGEPAPNIVYILADDLGYGDLHCYNPEGKIPTPHIDGLASAGTRFTDMHSGSAVCTPTRYGILTGRYAWRSKLQQGVLYGPSPALIPPGRMTVASFLKEQGYATACVGKWHLGLDWAKTGDGLDYAAPIANGPNALGFDYFFGIPASLDMPPYVFIENERVTEAPTETIEERVKPLYWRGGAIAPGFKHEDVHPTLTTKAVEVIEKHTAANDGKPLFLYLPLTSPHTPVLPTASKGRSGIGDYGDFVCDVDDTVGAVLAALEKAGMRGNTMVIFASDNGFASYVGLDALREKGHDPCPGLRGSKSDIFEGGHRVPFIIQWPGHVEAGKVRQDTAWLGDFFATAADVLNKPLPSEAAVDSESLLHLHDGHTARISPVVHHSGDGYFAIREGDWKLIFASHSGGGSQPKPKEAIDMPDLPPVQLYNLKNDLAEQHNLQAEQPDLVQRLAQTMQRIISEGRSTPGRRQKNDAEVRLIKP